MAEPVRPIARHPVFHDGELDAHRRFGVVDEAERMRDVVPTRLGIGELHFFETQPFMFVGAGAAAARLHQPGARRAASRSARIARPGTPSLNDGLEPDRTRFGTGLACLAQFRAVEGETR